MRPSRTPSCTSRRRPRRSCFSWQDLKPNRSLPISVPKATQSLATDTLTTDLGSYLKGELYSEPAPEGHINYTELVALDGALNHFEDRLQPSPLVWKVNNNTALVASAKQVSTRNGWMCSLIVHLQDPLHAGDSFQQVQQVMLNNN